MWRDLNVWWEFQAKGGSLWCKGSRTRERNYVQGTTGAQRARWEWQQPQLEWEGPVAVVWASDGGWVSDGDSLKMNGGWLKGCKSRRTSSDLFQEVTAAGKWIGGDERINLGWELSEGSLVLGGGDGDALATRAPWQSGLGWGLAMCLVGACFQAASERNNQTAEIQAECHFIPSTSAITFPLRIFAEGCGQMLAGLAWVWAQRPGTIDPKPAPCEVSGQGKGLEASGCTELSMDHVLCTQMQLKTVSPWNEQSAKTKIRSRHSHPIVCFRILGWGHL